VIAFTEGVPGLWGVQVDLSMIWPWKRVLPMPFQKTKNACFLGASSLDHSIERLPGPKEPVVFANFSILMLKSFILLSCVD